MAKELTGKIVLVTGASSGIGRAMALAVAAAGAQVALVGRSRERLQEVADLIGPDALVLPGDLGQPAEVERLAAEALKAFGRIDVLLPNAGLYIPGTVAEGNPDDWEVLMEVNVNSVFRLIHALLPQMVARASGDIVVTS